MFFLASAAGTALGCLSSLQQITGAFQSASGATGNAQPGSQVASFTNAVAQPPQLPARGGGSSGAGTTWPMSSQTMNTLLSAQGQAGGTSLSDQLFSMLDADSDGTISKSEFEAAFGQSASTDRADALFAKLDQDGDGAVSQKELSFALSKGGHGLGRLIERQTQMLSASTGQSLVRWL